MSQIPNVEVMPGPKGEELGRMLAALANQGPGRGFGLNLDELGKSTGLNVQEILKYLCKLEKEKYVVQRICQEGTGGPYSIRFALAVGIEISVVITKKSTC